MSRWVRLLRLHDRVWRATKHPLPKRAALCQKIHVAMIRDSNR